MGLIEGGSPQSSKRGAKSAGSTSPTGSRGIARLPAVRNASLEAVARDIHDCVGVYQRLAGISQGLLEHHRN
jgi:hypothetical protein